MRVVAYDPFVAAERFRELGVEPAASLDEVYAEADVITLHLPLNDETRGLLDAEAFAQMKDGVRIVNAARGGLVDEDALVDAIRSGKVAGAALDVFETEPYAGPLLELPQVVVTPHLAGSTAEAQDRAGVVIAEQVAAALDGRGRPDGGQHPGRRPARARGARPVRPARVEARPAGDGARRRVAVAHRRSPRTGRSPSTTRGS